MNKNLLTLKIVNFFKKDALLLLISLIIINTVFSLNSNLVLFFALFIMLACILLFCFGLILKLFSKIQLEHRSILFDLHKNYILSLNSNKNLHHIIAFFPNTITEIYIFWKLHGFNVTWVFIDNNKNYLFFTVDYILSDLIINENFKNDARFPMDKPSFLKN
jgi:hypothetical protein